MCLHVGRVLKGEETQQQQHVGGRGTGPRTGACGLCVSGKWKSEVVFSEEAASGGPGFSTRQWWSSM